MSNKQHAENTPRDPSGKWLPGTAPNPRGRPKGSRNAVTFTMKQALEQAFWDAGGVEWLCRLADKEPKVFAMLLLRLIPQEQAASDDDDWLVVYDPDSDIPANQKPRDSRLLKKLEVTCPDPDPVGPKAAQTKSRAT